MNRRMKLIFTISLLLNIIFIGVGAGMFYRFCNDRMDIPGNMSPEARSFMAHTFQQGREQIKPMIEQVKSQRSDVEDAITADTFDLEAYTKASDKMLDTRDAITRKRAQIMGEALVDLPKADRQTYARKIIEGMEGRRPHKGGYQHKMMREGKPSDLEKDTPKQ